MVGKVGITTFSSLADGFKNQVGSRHMTSPSALLAKMEGFSYAHSSDLSSPTSFANAKCKFERIPFRFWNSKLRMDNVLFTRTYSDRSSVASIQIKFRQLDT